MDADSQRFITGLEQDRRDLVRDVPKSDLHCHAGLGFRLEVLERWSEQKIAPPPPLMNSIGEMNQWIVEELSTLYQQRKCFEFAVKAALAEAWNDGVTLLEMSIDLSFISHFGNDPDSFARFLHEAHRVVAPEITFRPELGVARDADPAIALPLAFACLETGLFACLDLYGTEDAREPEIYQSLYAKAKSLGVKCKVHTGEFGDAASLMHTVMTLQPDALQHGIAAAGSEEAMHYLAQQNITLNICPTSNLKLSRVNHYMNHPIRRLYDAGVSVTINSDDIMLFGQNVTDEYLHVYRAGLLNASELNSIRINGLRQ